MSVEKIKPSALSLFCGAAGGWDLGLHRAGYRTVAACEIDPWRRAVFLANHPGTMMHDDVRTLTAERLRSGLGYLPDIVVGSPPCQDASAANTKGRGLDGERTGLFREYIRLVGEIRPVWCAAENSPRLRTRGYDRIAEGLEALGYAVWPLVVGADDVGANHRRKRVWILAADTDKLCGDETGVQTSSGRRVEFASGDQGSGTFVSVADTQRHGLREQSGWSSGTRGSSEAVASVNVADADCAQRRESALPYRAPEDHRSNPANDSHADRQGQHGCPRDGEVGGCMDRSAAHSDCARHTLGPGLGRDDGWELPTALGDIGCAWPDWNGGIAGLAAACAAAGTGRMDDGLPARLDPGARNRCIVAYGDAIAPQISEAIGRAFLQFL